MLLRGGAILQFLTAGSITHSDYCGNFQHGSETEAVSALLDQFYLNFAVQTRNNHYHRAPSFLYRPVVDPYMFEETDLYTVAKLVGVFLVALIVINAFDHLFRRILAGEFAWDVTGTLSVLVVLGLVVALGVQFFATR